MPNLGPAEILVILIVALIVFGPKKLPEIGKSLGKGLREFKKASNEFMNTLEAPDDDYYEPPRAKKENTDYATDSVDASGTGASDYPSDSAGSVRSEEASGDRQVTG